jgi:hypothetical protein
LLLFFTGFLPRLSAVFLLAIASTPVNFRLLRFAVNRVLVAEPAEFFQFQFIRRMHFILFGVVIALLALRACQRNPFTRTGLCHIGTSKNPVKTLVRAKKKTRASDKQKYSSTACYSCQTPEGYCIYTTQRVMAETPIYGF